MSRRFRLVFAALVAAFAISATACADVTGPRGGDCPQGQHSDCE